MKNEIYIVKCSKGCWDDYYTWNHYITFDKEKAEQVLQEYKEKIEEVLETPCPLGEDKVDKYGYLLDVFEETEEKYELYYEWYNSKTDAEESNEPHIEIYQLDTKL